jgi:hypothetical protein
MTLLHILGVVVTLLVIVVLLLGLTGPLWYRDDYLPPMSPDEERAWLRQVSKLSEAEIDDIVDGPRQS